MCKQPRTITMQKIRIVDGISLSNQQAVPCGKCTLCIKRKISDWLIRWTWELERSKRPLFITLTYNREHLPTTAIPKWNKLEMVNEKTGEIREIHEKIGETKISTLRKTDLQKFLKRLRYYNQQNGNYNKQEPIKYIACGEYGSKGGRPHYHIIMVNVLDNWEILKAWENKGIITIDPLKEGGLKYVLKYINKSNRKNTLQEKEFRISSSKIGDNYIKLSEKWHKENPKNSYCRVNGKTAAMPKYYKDKIYTTSERARVTKHQRERQIEKVEKNIRLIMKSYPKKTYEECVKILENRIESIKLANRNEKL